MTENKKDAVIDPELKDKILAELLKMSEIHNHVKRINDAKMMVIDLYEEKLGTRIDASLKSVGFVGSAVNPKTGKRYDLKIEIGEVGTWDNEEQKAGEDNEIISIH